MCDEDQPCRHHSASHAMELNVVVPYGEVTHRSRTGKRQLGQHLSKTRWKYVSLKEQQAKVGFFLPSQYCSYGVKSYLTPVLRGMALLRGSACHQDKYLSLLN